MPNVFIDVGCGNGNLINSLRNKCNITSIGIDRIDCNKYLAELNTEFLQSDICNDKSWLRKISKNNCIVHFGFCLLNTFPKKIFINIINSVLENISDGILLFELQNQFNIDHKYKPNRKYSTRFEEVSIISWNEIMYRNGEKCKKITMEYYSKDKLLINNTIDYLYPHPMDWEKEDNIFKSFLITKYYWDIRRNKEMSNSNIYYHIRRKP